MRAVLTIGVAVALLAPMRVCDSQPAALRFATFNIEDYPKSETQVEKAFALIRSLRVSAVALQEITQPEHFAREARARLGPGWRFVHTPYPGHRIGVLFDKENLELIGTHVHEDTVVRGKGKPTFEVRLRDQRSGARVRLFAVHLKAGGDGIDMRAQQLAGLARLLERELDPDSLIVVLGDFNATSPADRTTIASVADGAGLVWASSSLGCTSYWNRRDGCVGSALDHVLTSAAPEVIAAMGACATYGCDRRDRCPVYHREISDHCPVVLRMSSVR